MARKYKMPAVGTMLPGKETDADWPSATDQDAVLQFQQDQAQLHAFEMTQTKVNEFNSKLDSWLEYSYRAGRAVGPTGKVGDPKAQPPFGPPLAFFAVLTQGEAGVYWDSQQVELKDGGKLACKMPKWDKLPAPQHARK